jgi:hypothetical protein
MRDMAHLTGSGQQMMRLLAVLALVLGAAGPVAANDYKAIRDKSAFISLIEGRSLQLRLFRISLSVLPDGRIDGSALGWPVTGKWEWKDGYFCREMDWSGSPIPFNCQLVEARGDDQLRFTVDQGAGESATFRLR